MIREGEFQAEQGHTFRSRNPYGMLEDHNEDRGAVTEEQLKGVEKDQATKSLLGKGGI